MASASPQLRTSCGGLWGHPLWGAGPAEAVLKEGLQPGIGSREGGIPPPELLGDLAGLYFLR